MTGPELVTLGCRLNLAESAALERALAGADDLVIVNSCAVTAEAVADSRKAIRRARRRRPSARLVVTGCAAEIDPAAFAAMPEVDAIVANAAKSDPRRFLGNLPAPVLPAPRPRRRHARGFVAVQNGCDHRCTYCIIPAGRGAARSLPAGAAIADIRAAMEAGAQEIVLTGVDLTSYGPDLPGAPPLGDLVARILRHLPDLKRLRLSSLDPAAIDPRLEALLKEEPRLMPHVHLSLQAGDDLILKRMRRRHARADVVALVARLKAARPEIAIGADLIAGFPTEDEAMAARSLAMIEECDIVFAHVFPFSPRAGTPAARMPPLAPGVPQARAAALRAAGERQRAAWLATLVGTSRHVLVEGDGGSGHAENFAPVILEHADPLAVGQVRHVRIVAADARRLTAVPA